MSIVIRFVKEGQVQKTLVAMPTTKSLDAEAITILANLNDRGIDLQKMLSECYNGASVMSIKKGGVQKKIREKLGKVIPYVPYLNHQLHLVIEHPVGENSDIKRFFGTCNKLYNFATFVVLLCRLYMTVPNFSVCWSDVGLAI